MYFLSNPNIANGWGYSAQANGLELDQVSEIAGRGGVKIPSVLISRAVGGLGGMRRFRNLRSFLSHWR